MTTTNTESRHPTGEIALPEAPAAAQVRAVRKLLEENGCDCLCDHHTDERGADCEKLCLACRIGEAVGK